MELAVRLVRVPLRDPFVAAHGTVSDRELIVVSLRAADGLEGHGEAAPLQSYDGVSVEQVLAALDDCRAVLGSYPDASPVADVIARCSEATVVGPALAALDMALWDLAGRRVREPVWRLLGAARSAPIAVNRTIAAPDRSGAAREAAQARVDGFRTIKLKVGTGDDAGRLAAVRAFAGSEMAIRIDANGAWSHGEARAALAALEPVGLELCEEPVHGAAAIRALWTEVQVPVALDESAADPEALLRPAADAICLKVGRCGGISAMLDAAARARALGYDVYLASTLDGPLGIAAALHAATAIMPSRACGLATLALFDGRPDPLPPVHGAIVAPAGHGLGDQLIGWYPS